MCVCACVRVGGGGEGGAVWGAPPAAQHHHDMTIDVALARLVACLIHKRLVIPISWYRQRNVGAPAHILCIPPQLLKQPAQPNVARNTQATR